jgi:ABC-type multidrug transport system fused ATPase/permease subunit
MEDGRIVERGTHDALMAQRAIYYKMVMRQTAADDKEISAAWT